MMSLHRAIDIPAPQLSTRICAILVTFSTPVSIRGTGAVARIVQTRRGPIVEESQAFVGLAVVIEIGAHNQVAVPVTVYIAAEATLLL